jgi:hypothetical protein
MRANFPIGGRAGSIHFRFSGDHGLVARYSRLGAFLNFYMMPNSLCGASQAAHQMMAVFKNEGLPTTSSITQDFS